MQQRYTTLFVVAALAAVAFVVPAVGATQHVPEDVCRNPSAVAPLVIGAAVAETHLNWQPDCVNIFSKGTVGWTIVDLGHAPVAKGCFDRFELANGQIKEAKFSYLGNGLVKFEGPKGRSGTQTTICKVDSNNTQQREGPLVGLGGSSGTFLPVVEDEGDRMVIHYICAIHGARMHARIIVEKASA